MWIGYDTHCVDTVHSLILTYNERFFAKSMPAGWSTSHSLYSTIFDLTSCSRWVGSWKVDLQYQWNYAIDLEHWNMYYVVHKIRPGVAWTSLEAQRQSRVESTCGQKTQQVFSELSYRRPIQLYLVTAWCRIPQALQCTIIEQVKMLILTFRPRPMPT